MILYMSCSRELVLSSTDLYPPSALYIINIKKRKNYYFILSLLFYSIAIMLSYKRLYDIMETIGQRLDQFDPALIIFKPKHPSGDDIFTIPSFAQRDTVITRYANHPKETSEYSQNSI